MPETEPYLVQASDYIPNAALPLVVYTSSVPSMPAHDRCSRTHPSGGYITPGHQHLLSRMHRYDIRRHEKSVKEFSSSFAELELIYNPEGGEILTIPVDGILPQVVRRSRRREGATPLGSRDTNAENSRTVHDPVLTIPGPFRYRDVNADDDVGRVVHESVLTTASTISRQLFSSTPAEWTFQRSIEPGVHSGYLTPYVFANWNSRDSSSFTEGKMAVFVVPPWYLGPQDMQYFVNALQFRNTRIRKRDAPGPNLKRLHYWTMIASFCHGHGIRRFVLTTYEQWVFGCFSEDWTDAAVSDVQERTARSPSVLGTFLFWMHLHLPGEDTDTEHLYA
ncbi:hypothetical protein PLICRDRAFT_31748 [Plicaturopsis crispa FD-325 SS-3]|nr:hypothetical protein PLICRDRAFT_31748 [Plicaturopsis crispa FD-325 SS-3]